MWLTYSIIGFLLLSVIILFSLCLSFRAKGRIEFGKHRNTVALLKMQNTRNRMSSHFFFNALSGISTETNQPLQVKKDLMALSMLLRKSIENIEQIGIPLGEELDIVKGYIDLQRWRIAEPFQMEWDVAEEVDSNFLIPAMCIQIPVENAIKHGLMPLTGDKLLSVIVRNEPNGLKIVIKDNGIGISGSPDRTCGTGTGLRVLIQTIYLLNVSNASKIDFSVKERAFNQDFVRGTTVEIMVPVNYSFVI